MVNQHIVFAYNGENVWRCRRLNLGQIASRARHELRLLEVIAFDFVEVPESGEI
jgi:hypothetical protein